MIISTLQYEKNYYNNSDVLSYSHDNRVLIEFPYWNDLQFTSDDHKIESTYMYLFRGVYRVNTALEKIPGIEKDNILKQRLLAEARFLRAFYYFHLRIYFNKPPLVLKIISSYSESKLPNATAAEIWAQIETDLMEAIVVLPETYDSDNTGRATRGAAMALLGKTYLYQQKWAQTEDYLGRVIDLGLYQLSMPAGTDSIDYVNAYLCNFTPKAMAESDWSTTYTAENNSESVFEIQNNEDPDRRGIYAGGYGCNRGDTRGYYS